MVLILSACSDGPALYTCSDKIGCIDIAQGESVKIGILQTLTGGSAESGIGQLNAIRLNAKKRNNQILGYPIEFIVENDLCSEEGGKLGAERLVAEPNLIGILGSNCSSAAIPASELMSKEGMIMISSANSSPNLTSINGKRGAAWQPGYFRTSWNDIQAGRAAANFVRDELKKDRILLIQVNDAYSVGLSQSFSAIFAKLGGKTDSVIYNEEKPNIIEILSALKSFTPQTIFLSLSNPDHAAKIIKSIRRHYPSDALTIIGTDAMASESFFKEVHMDAKGMYLVTPGTLESPELNALRHEYAVMTGSPPNSFYLGLATDAADLLFDTIEAVATFDAAGVMHIGRERLRNRLYATSNYFGLSGRLTCNEFGDCGVARFNILKCVNPEDGVLGVMQNTVKTYSYTPI